MCVAPRLQKIKRNTDLPYSPVLSRLVNYDVPDSLFRRGKRRKTYNKVWDSSLECFRDAYSSDCVVVPCGKCAECLKMKRNSTAYCLEREFQKSASCIFVTFSYDEEHLPISERKVEGFCDDGVVETYYKQRTLSFEEVDSSVRQAIHSQYRRNRRTPRYHNVFLGDDGEKFTNMVYTPSLCRKNFVDMIARGRESFFHGHSDSERVSMKYYCIGEYGPNTCRPHFHCIFFGLSKADFKAYFEPYWIYGNCVIENCPKVFKAKSGKLIPGFVHLGRYLGKYMSKGVLECPSVKSGFAEKPRVISSHNIGNDLDSKLEEYVLMFDMVGRYDPDTLLRSNGDMLSEAQLELMEIEYPKRLRYIQNGYSYCIPSKIIDKIRYKCFYYVNSVSKKVQIGRELRPFFKRCQQAAESRYLAGLDREFEAYKNTQYFREGLPFSDYKARCEKMAIDSSLKALLESDRLFFGKSKF